MSFLCLEREIVRSPFLAYRYLKLIQFILFVATLKYSTSVHEMEYDYVEGEIKNIRFLQKARVIFVCIEFLTNDY